jgi:RNA polymerase sigma factor (sigma-70 family)
MTPQATAELSIRQFRSTPSSAPRRHAGCDDGLVELLQAARAGDDRAWERLYDRFTPMLVGIARGYRLAPSDVEDVLQSVWLRLVDHIDRLRMPGAVGGWLATTTRRECLRVLQLPVRECASGDPELGDATTDDEPDRELLESERRDAVHRALATLPEHYRRLMLLLVCEPDMDYKEVGSRLSMPVGSIGPIRARGLARLQRHPELRDFSPSSG